MSFFFHCGCSFNKSHLISVSTAFLSFIIEVVQYFSHCWSLCYDISSSIYFCNNYIISKSFKNFLLHVPSCVWFTVGILKNFCHLACQVHYSTLFLVIFLKIFNDFFESPTSSSSSGFPRFGFFAENVTCSSEEKHTGISLLVRK